MKTIDKIINPVKQAMIATAIVAMTACGGSGGGAVMPIPQTKDTTAPTKPTLTAAPCYDTTTEICLAAASTDNVGVTAYELFDADGNSKGPESQYSNFKVLGLTPNTAYQFKVKAKDAAGNESVFSDVASARTDALPVPTYKISANVTKMLDNIFDDSTDIMIYVVDSNATGTLEQKLKSATYKSSCGMIVKGDSGACDIDIPETLSGKIYAGATQLAQGTPVSAGVEVSKNTNGIVPLTLNEVLADNPTGTHQVSGNYTLGQTCNGNAYFVFPNAAKSIKSLADLTNEDIKNSINTALIDGNYVLLLENTGVPIFDQPYSANMKNNEQNYALVWHDCDGNNIATQYDAVNDVKETNIVRPLDSNLSMTKYQL